MRSTFARRSSAVLLAGTLALAGAACGGDEEDTGTGTESTEEATTEEDMGSTETSTEDMGSTETETSTEEATE